MIGVQQIERVVEVVEEALRGNRVHLLSRSKKNKPSLTLVYLPHLDYGLQRLGPDDPRIFEDIRLVDAEAGKCIDAARSIGADVIVVSEYAITPVSRPVHINRVLRRHGYVQARREPLGWETLDCGASRAFAVADHQVAHVYIRRPDDIRAIKLLLKNTDGVDLILDRSEQRPRRGHRGGHRRACRRGRPAA